MWRLEEKPPRLLDMSKLLTWEAAGITGPRMKWSISWAWPITMLSEFAEGKHANWTALHLANDAVSAVHA